MIYEILPESQKLLIGADKSFFIAFIECPYKALLEATNHSSSTDSLEFSITERLLSYATTALTHRIKRNFNRPSGLSGRKTKPNIQKHLHPCKPDFQYNNEAVLVEEVVEAISPKSNKSRSTLVPLFFLPTEKIRKEHKLFLAAVGLLISKLQNSTPPFGNIVCSSSFKVRRVQLQKLYRQARQITRDVVLITEGELAPPLLLNAHCNVCKFSKSCRAKAVEKDDLSLISTLAKPQILNLHKRGIFTVTQLSHTFRPRRSRRKKKTIKKHEPALKALSIRESKVYIKSSPELPSKPVKVFLDVEGIPDEGFYYLIGMKVCNQSTEQVYSFWADNRSDEARIWNDFLSKLVSVENFVLFHYGSYDAKFMKTMFTRYGAIDGITEELVLKSSVNVLNYCYTDVYFPTYSNGLKDIAKYLGFSWENVEDSGLHSIEQRYSWEKSRDLRIKKQLMRYNLRDCDALQLLTKTLVDIADFGMVGGSSVVNANNAPSDRPGQLGQSTFNFPEFDYINKCAYFDYQRTKIYWRTDEDVKKSVRRKATKLSRPQRINKVVECKPSRIRICPRCKIGKFRNDRSVTRTTYDIQFSGSGVKKWIVKYIGKTRSCSNCRKLIPPQHYPATNSKYQHGILAWVIYQNIELRQTHGNITSGLNQIFGFTFNSRNVDKFKKRAVEFYQTAYDEIVKSIRAGKLVHIDETQAGIKGGGGYVWVFTNLEEVLYVYSDSREGSIISETLTDSFKGAMVSDYYGAYDGFNGPQQRCLIHLIRDLNDDLFKNPFDDEFKAFVKNFGELLKPIIVTIDRHGLKHRFLKKHKKEVRKFFKDKVECEGKSELTVQYQERFKKNQSRLFTFLDYDGLPWNNNNAERAIKGYAPVRNAHRGVATPNGLRRTLPLLSIAQTLRNKNVSFLEFLKSGKRSLDDFLKMLK